MVRFRKIPVEVEAIRFTGSNWDALKEFTNHGFEVLEHGDRDDPFTAEVWDKLHDTWVGVKPGQWIIRGTKGEFYPCEDDGTDTAPMNYERP